MSWRQIWGEAGDRLGQAGYRAVDARRIVEEVSGLVGAEWILGLDGAVTEREMARFDSLVARRLSGEPLQYVLGRWGFRTLDLAVDRRALIPRPETEFVVEIALAEFDRLESRIGAGGDRLRVVDLGTGTGAIALSIAAERVGSEVWAVDRSPGAVDLARSNLAGLGRAATRVRVALGSWFDPLPPELVGRIDMIVSNPPYVADRDVVSDDVAAWEPAEALYSGIDGLDAIRTIVGGAPTWLCVGGTLVLEIAPTQRDAVTELLFDAGFTAVGVHPDLAGRDRVAVGRLR